MFSNNQAMKQCSAYVVKSTTTLPRLDLLYMNEEWILCILFFQDGEGPSYAAHAACSHKSLFFLITKLWFALEQTVSEN